MRRDSPARAVGDEPLLIHLRSGVPVAVGRDRVAAARAMLQAHPQLQFLISDDGLQHLRLPRALSILVFDRAWHRQWPCAARRPAAPTLSSAIGCRPTSWCSTTPQQASTALPGIWPSARSAVRCRCRTGGMARPASLSSLQALRGRPLLLAAAGMAQPQRFFDMLEALQGLRSRSALPYPTISTSPPCPGARPTMADVLVTEKDAVKLGPTPGSTPSGPRVWVVALDFRPEHAFEQAVHARLTAMGCQSREPAITEPRWG